MFFIDSSYIKFGAFLNYVFHNMVNEIGSKKYQHNVDYHFETEGVVDFYRVVCEFNESGGCMFQDYAFFDD